MSLPYHPKLAEILLCEFSRQDAQLQEGELAQGEMEKDRLVIVMNRKLPGRHRLVNVVPISMSPPAPVEPWHVLIPHCTLPPSAAKSRPGDRWAKCDMICTVSLDRLNFYQGHWNSKRDRQRKKRILEAGKLDMVTFIKVKLALAKVLEIHAGMFVNAEVKRELKHLAEDPTNEPTQSTDLKVKST